MDALEELRAAVHRDPKTVADKVVPLVAAARAADDPAQLSRALSVLGRARRSLGEIDLAAADLSGAIDAGAAAGDDELIADALIGLASVLSFAGRSTEAFVHLEEADRLASERLRAYVSLQRAVIEQRLGRRAEAVRCYDAALPMLRKIDARIDIAMVLVNRGVNRIHSGHCDAAIADLSEARALFDAENDDFGVARTSHGLGWAHARSGDIPRALGLLDDATERFGRLGHEALEVDVDRVEVLLAAGLFVAAGELATATATRLSTAGNHSEAAEVWLHCAQAASMGGDGRAAASYAERARSLFAEQAAIGWEQAAQLEVLRCSEGGAGELAVLADQLRASGNARGAATALALAAEAACRVGDLDHGVALAAECERAAARLGLFEVRMQSAHARATCAAAGSEFPKARRLLRSALGELARHRTSMQATDARASVAAHATELVRLGLRLALSSGSAAAVLTWIELARAGRGQDPSPRPPEDSDQAAALTELRSVVAQLNAHDPLEADTAELLLRQRDLERSIHRRQLRTESTPAAGAAKVASVSQLTAALSGGVLVELAAIEGRMTAVSVGRPPARLSDLGSEQTMYDVVSTLLAALRAAVASPSSRVGAGSPLGLLRRCLTELDTMVAGSVAGEGPVVLVVPPALHAVPWHLLPCLSGRGVTVAPSATWWLGAQSTSPPLSGPVTLVAGPRLSQADREVRSIARSYPDAIVLTGPAATSEAVMSALGDTPVAHLACHGRLRYDNPLWSALEFADGPMYVYDLERLPRTPAFVVLSGCETGVGVRAGDQLLGLSATFLEHGTRTLVASLCPLPDSAATRETMTALHEQVARGVPPAAALARLSSNGVHDERALAAACLSCFGAG